MNNNFKNTLHERLPIFPPIFLCKIRTLEDIDGNIVLSRGRCHLNSLNNRKKKLWPYHHQYCLNNQVQFPQVPSALSQSTLDWSPFARPPTGLGPTWHSSFAYSIHPWRCDAQRCSEWSRKHRTLNIRSKFN